MIRLRRFTAAGRPWLCMRSQRHDGWIRMHSDSTVALHPSPPTAVTPLRQSAFPSPSPSPVAALLTILHNLHAHAPDKGATGAMYAKTLTKRAESSTPSASASKLASTSTPTPTSVFALVNDARRKDLRVLNMLDWKHIVALVCPQDQLRSPAAHERAAAVIDIISSLQNNSLRDFDILNTYVRSAALSSTVKSVSDVHHIIDRLATFRVGATGLNVLANNFARELVVFAGSQLAWEAIAHAANVFSLMRDQNQCENPRMHRITCTTIANGFCFIGYSNAQKCEQARSALKGMIRMMEEDTEFVGDLLYEVLARVSSNGSSIENPCKPQAVYEFLQFACVEREWEPTMKAYGNLIHHAVRGRDLKLAVELLNKVNFRVDKIVIKTVVADLAKLDRYDLVVRICDVFQNEHPLEVDFASELKQACIQSWFTMKSPDSIDERIAFLESSTEAERKLWTIPTLLVLVQYYVHIRTHDKASECYELMKNHADAVVVLNTHTELSTRGQDLYQMIQKGFNHLMYGFAKKRDFAKCMDLYNTDRVNYGFSISAETCTVLISVFAFMHPIEASRFLQDYEALGSPGDVILYTSLIRGLTTAGRLEQAIELLHHMKVKGVSPNTNTFNSVIYGLCVAGKLQAAMDFMDVMDRVDQPPDVTTHNILCNAFLKRSRWADAQKVLDRMEARGVKWNVVTFNTLINAHIRREGGSLDEATHLFERMQEPPYNFSPDTMTYDAQLHWHVQCKKWNEAEELLHRLYPASEPSSQIVSERSPVSHAKSFQIVIRGYCDDGQLEPAKRLYYELTSNKWFKHTQDISANLTSIFVALIRCAAKVTKDLAYCKTLYEELVRLEPFANDTVNAAMIFAHGTCGDLQGAVKWANGVIPGAGRGVATLASIRGWGPLFDSKAARAVTSKKSNVAEMTLSRNRKASVNGKWTGAVIFGRGSTYALMNVHALGGNLELMEAVYAQLLRLESWGFSNKIEMKVNGSKYSINEANVLIQCYGLLKQGKKALDVWNHMWIAAPRSEGATFGAPRSEGATFAAPKGKSSVSSPALTEKYGVDRISVCNIVDALSFCGMNAELDTIWNTLLRSEFPLDLNDYIAYSESLARQGKGGECIEYIERNIIDSRHGLVLTPKVFWAVGPLLNATHRASLWDLMLRRAPQFESQLRKEHKFLASNQ
ncbi:hypothetical protein BC830DRAFT_1098810 [Chytriomyces sp. MP71]|nr:hypothetical protein BC830DRAFT_1098810 [Chytriomyces sp. MP71]